MLEQKLYTVADVAELTGLTSRTIRNYLKDRHIAGQKDRCPMAFYGRRY